MDDKKLDFYSIRENMYVNYIGEEPIYKITDIEHTYKPPPYGSSIKEITLLNIFTEEYSKHIIGRFRLDDPRTFYQECFVYISNISGFIYNISDDDEFEIITIPEKDHINADLLKIKFIDSDIVKKTINAFKRFLKIFG